MNSGGKGSGISFLLLFLLLLLVPAAMELQAQAAVRSELCFVWYNVENLFYPEDDTAAGDEEFTPEGSRHWTWSRYRDKLTALAKVIIASGRGEPPELVGLCEVEDSRVLADLCSHPILSPYQYSYLHRDSRDHRGMDVACLIRKGSMEVLHWESITFALPVTRTRDLMHISLSLGVDTLDLFLLHLLSKYGGAGATAELRRAQAVQLAATIDSVYKERQRDLLMAVGDFNETFQAYAMEPLSLARFGSDSLIALLPQSGSYKYQGRWTPIDQVLVLQSFPASIRISTLQLAPLLTEDLDYGGKKPLRCYEGYRYQGGISDHLPLVIDFSPSFLSVPAAQ